VAKQGAVDIAVYGRGSEKLGIVKGVERLQTELHHPPLRELEEPA
jgi:hypothetical protein